jgi:hypothetical protein
MKITKELVEKLLVGDTEEEISKVKGRVPGVSYVKHANQSDILSVMTATVRVGSI